jgi:6-phosphogluconolactonase/glucosamine-6-phosphate isomerase/deaminase
MPTLEDRIDRLEAQIQTVGDRDELVELTARYCRAVANEDMDTLISLFTDDATLETTFPPGSGQDHSTTTGHPALREQTRSVLAIHDSPKPPIHRLTLTLPVLTAARLVVVAAAGTRKAAVVREALEREDSQLPVSFLARGARRVLFLLNVETGPESRR